MRSWYRRPLETLATIVVSIAALPLAVAAQTGNTPARASAAKSGAAAKLPWGEPDLQGVWTGSTITPLERSKRFADKEFLTDTEVAAAEKSAVDAQVDKAPAAGDPGTYNQIWFDPSSRWIPSRRSSLITDPPDGRIPFTPEGRRLQEASKAHYGKGNRDSFRDLDTGERCITDGLPMYWSGYNNNYLIVQSPGYVTILHELYRELRVIPTSGQPRAGLPRWLGESRGHWEGNTLVVETTNFVDRKDEWWADAWRASRATTKLVERFTRVNGTTLDYQFTWEDPTMFTRPWTASFPLSTDQASRGVTVGGLYEYACHEGNYAMTHTLSGARAQEKADIGKRGSN